MDNESLTDAVIGAAIEVHSELGPGLLESTYQKCLTVELQNRNISHYAEATLPIHYKNLQLDAAYRLDIYIPGQLIIEIKSVSHLLPVHMSQLITYLKLSNIKTGLLINFNQKRLVEGLKRISF